MISESDFLLKVTCSGLSADNMVLYFTLESARLPRLDKAATETLIDSISSSDRLRLTYVHTMINLTVYPPVYRVTSIKMISRVAIQLIVIIYP